MNNQFYVIDGIIIILLAIIIIIQQIYFRNKIKFLEMVLSIRKLPTDEIEVKDEENISLLQKIQKECDHSFIDVVQSEKYHHCTKCKLTEKKPQFK